jgi:hypothetical protein
MSAADDLFAHAPWPDYASFRNDYREWTKRKGLKFFEESSEEAKQANARVTREKENWIRYGIGYEGTDKARQDEEKRGQREERFRRRRTYTEEEFGFGGGSSEGGGGFGNGAPAENVGQIQWGNVMIAALAFQLTLMGGLKLKFELGRKRSGLGFRKS